MVCGMSRISCGSFGDDTATRLETDTDSRTAASSMFTLSVPDIAKVAPVPSSSRVNACSGVKTPVTPGDWMSPRATWAKDTCSWVTRSNVAITSRRRPAGMSKRRAGRFCAVMPASSRQAARAVSQDGGNVSAARFLASTSAIASVIARARARRFAWFGGCRDTSRERCGGYDGAEESQSTAHELSPSQAATSRCVRSKNG